MLRHIAISPHRPIVYGIQKRFWADASPHRYFTTSPHRSTVYKNVFGQMLRHIAISPHRYFTTSPHRHIALRYTKAFLGRCFATSLFHHIAISPHHHIALRYTKTFLGRCFATSLFHHIATSLYGIQKRFWADASPHRYFTTSPHRSTVYKSVFGQMLRHIAISPHHHITTSPHRHIATSPHRSTVYKNVFVQIHTYANYVSLCFYVFQNCSSKNLTKIRRFQKVALPLHPLRQRGLIEQHLHPKLLASKTLKKLCKKLCQN
jgi:hypothetical protein